MSTATVGKLGATLKQVVCTIIKRTAILSTRRSEFLREKKRTRRNLSVFSEPNAKPPPTFERETEASTAVEKTT